MRQKLSGIKKGRSESPEKQNPEKQPEPKY